MKEHFKSIVVKILNLEAAFLIKRRKPTIVAITGSVGKTSTKDAVYAAIKNHTYARKSHLSYNSDIGVSLTILGLQNAWNNPFLWLLNIIEGFFIAVFAKDYPAVLVLEMGIDRPGDMEKLTKFITPDIVVLTRLPDVPVHVEYFSSPEAVIAEKMKLVSALKADGVLIYNNDDTIIQGLLAEILPRQVGFGRYLETDFTASGDKVVYHDDQPIGVEFRLKHLGDSYKVLVKNIVGSQNVYSTSAALAVANELRVPLTEAVESLKSLETPNGRMKLIKGIKSSVIIDDTYNSSPVAVEQAFEAIKELSYAKRKILVLGDMLELGKFSSDEHKRIGTLAPRVANVLFTVGIRARQFAEGALIAGMSEKNIYQFDDVAQVGRELQNFIQPGDVVLIKASQGIRAEKIVEEIMNEPDKASELLVRKDEKWQSIA
jgi:UDP-N-acetylmuramoyl-tripeptide--D-alanyl-D-alanine ligase